MTLLCCVGERGYDESKYFNNAVVRLLIDDHNVPSLKQIIDFIKDAERWMNANKNNVMAIHCKGLSVFILPWVGNIRWCYGVLSCVGIRYNNIYYSGAIHSGLCGGGH